MEAANVVPHMLAPQEAQPPQTDVKTMKSTHVEVSKKDLPTSDLNASDGGTSKEKDDVATSGNDHRRSHLEAGSGQDAAFTRTDEDPIRTGQTRRRNE